MDPDVKTAELVAESCRAFRVTEVAADFEAATAVLESPKRLVALICELELPGGNGMDLILRVRKERPLLPILVLTSRTDPALINRAHRLRAEYHCKPTHRSSLRGFLRRAVAFERVPDERTTWAIDEVARRKKLSPREVEVLIAAVAGVSRKVLADELGTSENTLKTQIRSVLRKCSAGTLEELARSTLQLALSESDTPRFDTLPPESEHRGPPTIRPSARSSGTRDRLTPSPEELEEFRKRMQR